MPSRARAQERRSPSCTRSTNRSYAAPSRTAVIVTMRYAGPVPCAWWRYQSKRASSSPASAAIQPSRKWDSNASSFAPRTWWTSWRKSVMRLVEHDRAQLGEAGRHAERARREDVEERGARPFVTGARFDASLQHLDRLGPPEQPGQGERADFGDRIARAAGRRRAVRDREPEPVAR